MTNLRNYITLSARDKAAETFDGTTFQAFGLGNGMFGLPGDFSPPSRFVRATAFTSTAIKAADAKAGIFSGFHILNNFDIPYGVSLDVADGTVHADQTIFTVMRDPQNLKIYFKSYDDQTIRMVDMKRFDLDAKDVMRLPSTSSNQPVVDMTGLFIAKKTANVQ
jgi:choloylglycine hydrolase